MAEKRRAGKLKLKGVGPKMADVVIRRETFRPYPEPPTFEEIVAAGKDFEDELKISVCSSFPVHFEIPSGYFGFGRVLTCNPYCKRERHHFGPCLPFTLADVEDQPSGTPMKALYKGGVVVGYASGSLHGGCPERLIDEGRVYPEGWVWKGWKVEHQHGAPLAPASPVLQAMIEDEYLAAKLGDMHRRGLLS